MYYCCSWAARGGVCRCVRVCTCLCATNWRNWDGCRFYYSQTVVIVLVGLCDNVMTRPKVISDWLSSWDFHILPSWNKNLLSNICDFDFERGCGIEMEFKIPYGIKLLKTVQYFYFDCSFRKPKILRQIICIYLWFWFWTNLQWLFICSHCSSGQMNVVWLQCLSSCLNIYDQMPVQSFSCLFITAVPSSSFPHSCRLPMKHHWEPLLFWCSQYAYVVSGATAGSATCQQVLSNQN